MQGRPRLDSQQLPQPRLQLELASELGATRAEPLVDSWHSTKTQAANRQNYLLRRSVMIWGAWPPVKASIKHAVRGGWHVVIYLRGEP